MRRVREYKILLDSKGTYGVDTIIVLGFSEEEVVKWIEDLYGNDVVKIEYIGFAKFPLELG